MNNKTITLYLLTLAAISGMAIVPVVVKLSAADPWLIGFVRLAIASLGLAILFRSRVKLSELRANWRILATMGVVFATHWLTYFYSIKLSTPSIAAIGVATFGVHLLILGWLLLGKSARALEVVAVALSMIGVLLVSPLVGLDLAMLPGLLLGVLSGLLYAVLPILHQRNNHLGNMQRAFGMFFFAMPVFALGLTQSNWALTLSDWGWLLVLGIVSTLLAHSLWVKVTTELPHNVTSVLYYLYIPAAMALSFWFTNEQLGWQKIAGAALVIGANLLVVAAGVWRRSKTVTVGQ